jgi:hypothetical protein
MAGALRFDPASRAQSAVVWSLALVPIVAIVALLVVKQIPGPWSMPRTRTS